MSGFVLKVRAGTAPLREFRCPEHGVFESREVGDEVPCPVILWALRCLSCDFWNIIPAEVGGCATVTCVGCGRSIDRACAEPSPRCFTTAPLGRLKLGEVARGKVAETPGPLALDTRPLAEGMSTSEWKARRSKLWSDHRRAEWKKKMG